jgi:hypothetical protein
VSSASLEFCSFHIARVFMHKDTVVLKAVNWHGQLIAGQGSGCLISLLARSKLSFQGCQGLKHGEWVIVSKSEVIVLNKV